jgi:hypothetical protein
MKSATGACEVEIGTANKKEIGLTATYSSLPYLRGFYAIDTKH